MNHMFFGLEVMSRNIRRQLESEQRWMCTLTLRVLVLQDELVDLCDASNPTLSICTICMGTTLFSYLEKDPAQIEWTLQIVGRLHELFMTVRALSYAKGHSLVPI